jgi:hypothetical protein
MADGMVKVQLKFKSQGAQEHQMSARVLIGEIVEGLELV